MTILELLKDLTSHDLREEAEAIIKYGHQQYAITGVSYDRSMDCIVIHSRSNRKNPAQETFQNLKPFEPVIYRENGEWKKGLFDKRIDVFFCNVINNPNEISYHNIYPYDRFNFLENTDIPMRSLYVNKGITYKELIYDLVSLLRDYENTSILGVIPGSKIPKEVLTLLRIAPNYDEPKITLCSR